MTHPGQSGVAAAVSDLLDKCAGEAMSFAGRSWEFRGVASQGLLLHLAAEHPAIAVRAMIARWKVAIERDGMAGHAPEFFVRVVMLDGVERTLEGALDADPGLMDEVCVWLTSLGHLILAPEDMERIMVRAITQRASEQPLTVPMAELLRWIRARWLRGFKPNQARIAEIGRLLGLEEVIPVHPGEAWSDAVIKDVGDSKEWTALMMHCALASSSAPSAKWLRAAAGLLEKVGAGDIRERLLSWFPLVDKPRTDVPAGAPARDALVLSSLNMDILRGLCWLVPAMQDPDLSRALGKLAISAYRKVPGIGPRAVRVGNAAVYSLGQTPGMDAVGQLAMLRVKVKFGSAQAGIEKALAAAAAREGIPREEIDELGVPSYGLTEVGRRVETMGEFDAELVVTGIGSTELRFIKKDGKAQKSVPAAIKAEFADDLKELKSAAKDVGAMLPAQRDRIDSLFLENKTWDAAAWRERYLDHPLVGVLSRRLIWLFRSGNDGAWRAGTFDDEKAGLVDVGGAPLEVPDDGAVRLWHPIEAPRGTEEVLAWRRYFEERKVRQPFKQAHREIYLLTDAERRTETYSNRYAAHVLRQHQFNALCAVRSWKNKLRLLVDAEYPPAYRPLPAWGLRAEYWIEGAGGDYGTDTNEAGVYHLLTTDQVRFYAIGTELASAHASGGGYGSLRGADLQTGVPLTAVPALVLSEIMRDVDLFVGVCSVAANPEWQDGGPGAVHRNYWWSQSFGDLTASGSGRRELLERLIPRLKIATACSFQDKFLVVRGTLRTYKIHLGSGNILMEPDDQYLCIVPGAVSGAGAAAGEKVFLPFEGDRTLSVILSKAFMLAADDKITDPSITRQIRRA